jgi:hypothetical protein
MAIRFLHGTPLNQIDRLCQEEEKVMIEISSYRLEYYPDGTIEWVKTGGWGSQIHSSKDLFQYDNEDINVLSDDTKESLR